MLKKLFTVLFVLYMPIVGANDFPTQARVEYVFGCMQQAGGPSYDSLYACVCEIDRIAAQVSYAEYIGSQTLTFLYQTPGERGGVFRDAAPNSRERIKSLAQLSEDAKATCAVKRVQAKVQK